MLPRRADSVKRDVVLRPKEPAADPWRPPEAWQCPAVKAEEILIPPPKSVRRIKERKRVKSSELTHLQGSIRKMSAASAKIMLERLKEEWVGVADASVYRELELEKQLWMLASLKVLAADDDCNLSVQDVSTEPALMSKKMLSLYENKGQFHLLEHTA